MYTCKYEITNIYDISKDYEHIHGISSIKQSTYYTYKHKQDIYIVKGIL